MRLKRTALPVIAVFFVLALLTTLAGLAASTPATGPLAGAPSPKLRLATTTSVQDTGLLDYLLPAFERENNVDVEVIAAGSAVAMQMGEGGDADVLIAQSPAAEEAFMRAGHGSDRAPFAYSYYVIVGPTGDPAGTRGMDDPAKAFQKIYDTRSTFVGRGDSSGTAAKEAELWKAAGRPVPDQRTIWYKSTGADMTETLRIADEINGYTLSDKSTFLHDRRGLRGLEVHVDALPDMINAYDVIVVSKAQHPGVNSAMAQKFLDYLISPEVQAKISQYGRDTAGQPLFMAGQPALETARKTSSPATTRA